MLYSVRAGLGMHAYTHNVVRQAPKPTNLGKSLQPCGVAHSKASKMNTAQVSWAMLSGPCSLSKEQSCDNTIEPAVR